MAFPLMEVVKRDPTGGELDINIDNPRDIIQCINN
jgi:hypothetical protein